MKRDHFEILARGRSDTHCEIKETLLIRDLEPSLDENFSSEKLYLFWFARFFICKFSKAQDKSRNCHSIATLNKFICVLDQASRSRRLDFSFLRFYGADEVEVNKNAKRTRPIYSHLDQTGLVNKGFIKWPKRKDFLAGPTREIPSRQDGPISCSFG